MTDLSLLQDFITEAGEHLEEMEENILRLESDPGNKELLNNIFRNALFLSQLFDKRHRIQGIIHNSDSSGILFEPANIH